MAVDPDARSISKERIVFTAIVVGLVALLAFQIRAMVVFVPNEAPQLEVQQAPDSKEPRAPGNDGDHRARPVPAGKGVPREPRPTLDDLPRLAKRLIALDARKTQLTAQQKTTLQGAAATLCETTDKMEKDIYKIVDCLTDRQLNVVFQPHSQPSDRPPAKINQDGSDARVDTIIAALKKKAVNGTVSHGRPSRQTPPSIDASALVEGIMFLEKTSDALSAAQAQVTLDALNDWQENNRRAVMAESEVVDTLRQVEQNRTAPSNQEAPPTNAALMAHFIRLWSQQP